MVVPVCFVFAEPWRGEPPDHPSCSRNAHDKKERRGQARGSPVLVQRAVSEDPRWTRAVGDPLARPQGEIEERRSFDTRSNVIRQSTCGIQTRLRPIWLDPRQLVQWKPEESEELSS
jgi:hypothetical protein